MWMIQARDAVRRDAGPFLLLGWIRHRRPAFSTLFKRPTFAAAPDRWGVEVEFKAGNAGLSEEGSRTEFRSIEDPLRPRSQDKGRGVASCRNPKYCWIDTVEVRRHKPPLLRPIAWRLIGY